ncbi:MAG TPA: MBL fold metallo-hydrolase [Halococcus sp.]|nr:MBL fold metallo-hydrolase [Halococcus sp.]
MAIGDVRTVETGDCIDLSYVDTGMYDTDAYGAVYILDAERPAIIESGIGTHHDRILDALAELDIARTEIEVIALTHIHLDHAGGAGFLTEACPNAEVAVHEIGVSHLTDPDQLTEGTKQVVGDLWQFYVEPKPVPEDRIRRLGDGDTIDLGNHRLDVHHAPGHAPHQVVYYDRENDAVFTGDEAGIWIPSQQRVKETTPPWGFDLEKCLADLETIRALDPETLLYSHFGPQSSPKSTLTEYERVLTDWVETVETKREELEDDAVIEYFVNETEMGEVWDEAMANPVAAVDVRGVLHYLDQRE